MPLELAEVGNTGPRGPRPRRESKLLVVARVPPCAPPRDWSWDIVFSLSPVLFQISLLLHGLLGRAERSPARLSALACACVLVFVRARLSRVRVRVCASRVRVRACASRTPVARRGMPWTGTL